MVKAELGVNSTRHYSGPASGPQTGTSCQISGGMRFEIKYTIKVMLLNYPETVPPPPPPSVENCLPLNLSLVPKRLGTTDITRERNSVTKESHDLGL